MKIYYGKAIYGKKEIDAVNKVLKKNSLNLIDGPHVKLLENNWKSWLGNPLKISLIPAPRCQRRRRRQKPAREARRGFPRGTLAKKHKGNRLTRL